jgi:NAD(P)-dependent dehydrogenase (short-subunit alcohol dehydrogenase family)
MTDDDWYSVIDVNLNGTYLMCKYIVPIMREQESGAIVNMSSTSLMGNPGQANYAATKAALIGFTNTLAKEAGRKNITVNCVAPGATKTDMYLKVPEQIMNSMIESHPMKRLGKPTEIGEVIAFLASDRASFLSGQWIPVNGGK